MKFLLDENVLGLDSFLKNRVEYCKVGDDKCPDRTADDPEIVKFAKDNNLIIVTKDIKMINECKFESVKYITINDLDFAKKIINYNSGSVTLWGYRMKYGSSKD